MKKTNPKPLERKAEVKPRTPDISALVRAVQTKNLQGAAKLLAIPKYRDNIDVNDHQVLKEAMQLADKKIAQRVLQAYDETQKEYSQDVYKDKTLRAYIHKKLSMKVALKQDLITLEQAIDTQNTEALTFFKAVINCDSNGHIKSDMELLYWAMDNIRTHKNVVLKLLRLPSILNSISDTNHAILQYAMLKAQAFITEILTIYIERKLSLIEFPSIFKTLIPLLPTNLLFLKQLIRKQNGQEISDIELLYWSLEHQHDFTAKKVLPLVWKEVTENITIDDHKFLKAIAKSTLYDERQEVIDIYFAREIPIPDCVAQDSALAPYITHRIHDRALGATLLDSVTKGDLQCLMGSIGYQDTRVLEQYGIEALKAAINQYNLSRTQNRKHTIVNNHAYIVFYLLRFKEIQKRIDCNDNELLKLIPDQNPKDTHVFNIGPAILKLYFRYHKPIPFWISCNEWGPKVLQEYKAFQEEVETTIAKAKEKTSRDPSSDIRSYMQRAVKWRDSASMYQLVQASALFAADNTFKVFGFSDAMDSAIRAGYPDMAILLCEYAHPQHITTSPSQDELLYLVEQGDIDFLRQVTTKGGMLIDKHPDPIYLASLLYKAAEKGNLKFLQGLIGLRETRNSLDQENAFSLTDIAKINPLKLLYKAAKGGNLQVLELLLQENNIKIYLKDINPKDFLISGIESRNVLMVQSISNVLGANINTTQEQNVELFSKAITSRDPKILDLVLKQLGEPAFKAVQHKMRFEVEVFVEEFSLDKNISTLLELEPPVRTQFWQYSAEPAYNAVLLSKKHISEIIMDYVGDKPRP